MADVCVTDSNDSPLSAVREIDPCMFCRFYRDNEAATHTLLLHVNARTHEAAMDILNRLVYSRILTTLFFITIAVTTTITTVKLHRVDQWRRRSTSSASVSLTSSIKEIALTKTLVATSVLFIFCLAPTIMVEIASFVEPEFYFTGRYYNLAFVMQTVMIFSGVSNSSFNFFIYYDMSTQYRQPLRDIFRLCLRKRTESER